MQFAFEVNTLVVKSAQIDELKNYYELLGAIFVKEKHGNGVEHYSSQNISPTIEIYPDKKEIKNHLALFMKIKNMDDYQSYLSERGVKYEKTNLGIYLRDPDDNRIEILKI
jgi:hypothetical protein